MQKNHINHRIIIIKDSQINGMKERFDGRISEVVKQTRFDSGQHLKDVLLQHCRIYKHNMPQKNLGHITPIASLKIWGKSNPDIFKETIYNYTGLDT